MYNPSGRASSTMPRSSGQSPPGTFLFLIPSLHAWTEGGFAGDPEAHSMYSCALPRRTWIIQLPAQDNAIVWNLSVCPHLKERLCDIQCPKEHPPPSWGSKATMGSCLVAD